MTVDTGVRYVYILACADGSLYVGTTPDLFSHLDEHQKGEISDTEDRRPIQLVWATQTTKDNAASIEKKVKAMPLEEKHAIIASQVKL